MTRTVTAPNQKSAMQTLPTLSQMVRDGQADTIQHGRRTRESLDYWFRQSERLNIARSSLQIARHPLHGFRPPDWCGSRQRVPACQAAQASCHDPGGLPGRTRQRPSHGAKLISILAGAPLWNGLRASHHAAGRLPTHGDKGMSRHARRQPHRQRCPCTKATACRFCVPCVGRSRPMSA